MTDVSEVLGDEAVELVVEVMGGTDLAKTVVTSALRSGKHVVTANKALIAAHLPELNVRVRVRVTLTLTLTLTLALTLALALALTLTLTKGARAQGAKD